VTGWSERLSSTQLALAMPASGGIRSRLVAYVRNLYGSRTTNRRAPEMEGAGGSEGSREANE